MMLLKCSLGHGDDKGDDNGVGSDVRNDVDGNVGEVADYVAVDRS